jgi:hypothetical protein
LPGVAVGPYSDVFSFGKTCCYALFTVPVPDSKQWGTVPDPLAEWLRECVSEQWQERSRDFEVVLARLDQVSRRKGVDLAVPGRWLARPTNEPEAQWEFLGHTPRRVTLLYRLVYRLETDSGVTDAELASLDQLRDLTALQDLDLRGCGRVTDAGLAHLAGLTALQVLSLRGCENMTDAGLAHLAGLTALQDLDLEWCKNVTDAGLAHLQGLTGLQRLDLAWCKNVTDAGLAHLRGLTALQHLRLWGCREVTDAGLAHLRGLAVLQLLDLRGCWRVTEAGLKSLQDALPKCRIESDS